MQVLFLVSIVEDSTFVIASQKEVAAHALRRVVPGAAPLVALVAMYGREAAVFKLTHPAVPICGGTQITRVAPIYRFFLGSQEGLLVEFSRQARHGVDI